MTKIRNFSPSQIKYMENIRSQLDKLGIEPSSKESPLKNTYLEEFYSTPKGKEARMMNLAALNGIKANNTMPPKAKYEEDKELFSSNDADKVKKWVQWVNPKSGKMYTVINKGDNTDGTRLARILDETGEVVIERNIKPKKVIIIDNFKLENPEDEIESFIKGHGLRVKQILERNNPLADVECMNAALKGINLFSDMSTDKVVKALKDILERLKNGEQIDAINCSFGTGFFNTLSDDKTVDNKIANSYPVVNSQLLEKSSKCSNLEKEIIHLIQEITNYGTRVVVAAGNNGPKSIIYDMGVNNADITGALDLSGKVADFSSSRQFSRHYELGEIPVKVFKNGINVTGKPGIDMSYNGTWFEKYQGKNLKDCLLDALEMYDTDRLEEEYAIGIINKKEYKEQMQKYKGKIVPTGRDNQYIGAEDTWKPRYISTDKEGNLIPYAIKNTCLLKGTSFAAPQRTARITLNETMNEILE